MKEAWINFQGIKQENMEKTEQKPVKRLYQMPEVADSSLPAWQSQGTP